MTDQPPPDSGLVVQLDQSQIVKDEILRKMDHRDWLEKFASVLNLNDAERPRPMTPFRAGAITRLKMAAAYIELLQREARDNLRQIAALEHHLNELEGR